jgi:hypothetical protein
MALAQAVAAYAKNNAAIPSRLLALLMGEI